MNNLPVNPPDVAFSEDGNGGVEASPSALPVIYEVEALLTADESMSRREQWVVAATLTKHEDAVLFANKCADKKGLWRVIRVTKEVTHNTEDRDSIRKLHKMEMEEAQARDERSLP